MTPSTPKRPRRTLADADRRHALERQDLETLIAAQAEQIDRLSRYVLDSLHDVAIYVGDAADLDAMATVCRMLHLDARFDADPRFRAIRFDRERRTIGGELFSPGELFRLEMVRELNQIEGSRR